MSFESRETKNNGIIFTAWKNEFFFALIESRPNIWNELLNGRVMGIKSYVLNATSIYAH